RILFVGSMGQRKGLGDLFAAMRHFSPKEVELVVMGSLLAPMEFYKEQLPHFRYEGGRPNEQVLTLMRSCDVFCLPSIVVGRALVMQEAMSQGLPIIITPNTGGEDLVCEAGQIRRGETGKLKAEVGKAETGRSAKRVEGQSSAIDPAGMSNSGAQRAEVDTKLKTEGFDLPQVSGLSSQLSPSRCVRSATGFLVPIRSPEAIA